MKRRIVILLLCCLFLCAGCSSVDRNVPVFQTEGVTTILFIGQPYEEVEVQAEYLAEITEWLSTFRIGDKVKGDALPPGSNSIRVRLLYDDGSMAEEGLSAVEVDGEMYELEHEPTPDCWFEIFGE